MKKAIAIILTLLFLSCAFALSETMQKGDSGAGVLAIQRILSAMDYLSAANVTGDFDDLTEIAVLAFQLDHGLDPTGLADDTTTQEITRAFRSTNASTPAQVGEAIPERRESVNDDSEMADILAATVGGTESAIITGISESAQEWLQQYKDQGIDVVVLSSDILYEYGSSYVGQTVVTSFTVKEKDNNCLKADTENNDTYSFSIVAYFKMAQIKSVSTGQSVVVVGTVDDFSAISIFGTDKTVTLRNCQIVTEGITASDIEASREEQIQGANAQVQAKAEAEAQAKAEEEQTYIDQCVTVEYEAVERNPKQYEGMPIKVEGYVEQVSEGWFGSVTMRVNEGGGNMWYVTYTMKDDESRILEGDDLTFYGECDGVETYTSILGSRITIPALTAKMYR